MHSRSTRLGVSFLQLAEPAPMNLLTRLWVEIEARIRGSQLDGELVTLDRSLLFVIEGALEVVNAIDGEVGHPSLVAFVPAHADEAATRFLLALLGRFLLQRARVRRSELGSSLWKIDVSGIAIVVEKCAIVSYWWNGCLRKMRWRLWTFERVCRQQNFAVVDRRGSVLLLSDGGSVAPCRSPPGLAAGPCLLYRSLSSSGSSLASERTTLLPPYRELDPHRPCGPCGRPR
jgi:hypothetical protein